MSEGGIDDGEATGEDNALWEPPCLAEEDDTADDDDATVDVVNELSDATYDALNETVLTPEEYDQILQTEGADLT